MKNLDLEPMAAWLPTEKKPVIISGPCSAETEEQVLATARLLAAGGRVHALRAGIWKPRTRPGHYEGAGEAGLAWLAKAKAETGLPIATEVANAAHVEACLGAGVDILWVGARTTVNPFSVQEIADALAGVDARVLVKNPINPDLELWIGALERLNKAGVTKLAAVHRGFSTIGHGPFRNDPMWDIPAKLMARVPGIDVLCDPSHISGLRELIALVSQKALDLGMAGLMIESHVNPDAALSDARQQVTPGALAELIDGLLVRTVSAGAAAADPLGTLRKQIDHLDDEIMQKLAARMKVAEQIGEYKRQSGLKIVQADRWQEIVQTRVLLGEAMGLDPRFTGSLLKLLHRASIRVQGKRVKSQ